jgi:preprotein translocase subunit SecY
MWEKLIIIFKDKELRNKILFVLAMLVVFRLAAAIPIPGVDLDQLQSFFANNQFFGLLNIFSGGALANLSIAMLGVGPYITAVIIMQLLTMIFPRLKEMYSSEGEQGRQKFNQYGRLLTVPLAALQGYGLLALLQRQNVVGFLTTSDILINVLVVTAGSVFLMWIGELISEKGIGNGISIMIFAGIVAALPQTLRQLVFTYSPDQIPTYVAFIVVAFVVSYAKRVRGFRVYGGSFTHLPLKVNQAGVIPIIFALSILLFPGMIANFLSLVNVEFLANAAQSMSNFFNNPVYYAVSYFVLVMLFTYFYTAVTFDPKTISENLQKQGAFVPGIRPGATTADFITKIMNRITLVGAIFLGLIAILPFITQSATGIGALALGGTGLLIVVAVVLEIIRQVEGQLAMREYS